MNTAIRNVFGSNANFSEIDAVLTQEASNFTWDEDLVTFVDNHDMTRFLSLNNNNNRLHQAMAFIFTQRGIPCIYYGTEQYLHNDTSRRRRPVQPPDDERLLDLDDRLHFDQPAVHAPAQQHGHPLRLDAAALDEQRRVHLRTQVLRQRRARRHQQERLDAITTSPASTRRSRRALTADYLTGLIGGSSINVTAGTGGNNPVAAFNLPANTVAVWQFTESGGTPQVGSIGPTVAQPGVKVTIGGKNFGATQGNGNVKFGTTNAAITSWSDTKIVVTVPTVTNGNYNVTVTKNGGQVSNGIQFTVLQAKLIPVTFTVYNASPTQTGDYIFLTGNTVELGNWSTTWDGATGPMLTPNYPNWFINASVPAGKTIQFKFIKIAANGAVTWEAGANHSYTVPTSGTGFVNVNWQY